MSLLRRLFWQADAPGETGLEPICGYHLNLR